MLVKINVKDRKVFKNSAYLVREKGITVILSGRGIKDDWLFIVKIKQQIEQKRFIKS